MAKVTQVDFPPRETVSYTKETQTPVMTQQKEGDSLRMLYKSFLNELCYLRCGCGEPKTCVIPYNVYFLQGCNGSSGLFIKGAL